VGTVAGVRRRPRPLSNQARLGPQARRSPEAFRARVEAVVGSLRPGEIVSYGDVAAQAGFPGAARAVGAILAHPGPGSSLPWWRVVTASGRLVPGHEREHARRLRAEGVTVRDGHVRPVQRQR
jgi:methylated-DNA-protein-cysteine methyltransferase related protein